MKQLPELWSSYQNYELFYRSNEVHLYTKAKQRDLVSGHMTFARDEHQSYELGPRTSGSPISMNEEQSFVFTDHYS